MEKCLRNITHIIFAIAFKAHLRLSKRNLFIQFFFFLLHPFLQENALQLNFEGKNAVHF